mmetsp:Transcript_20876/g.29466  ORF Transcript_20876/g.29466 Transcript_20876/m.29466 type:complete len:228 (+) Transcript_20876:169-852(+)
MATITMFPDFPHNIEEEPTEDWTVEEVMQWCLLRSHQATEHKHDELIGSLNKQLEVGKQEIWNCHEQVVESLTKGDENEQEDDGDENINPNPTTASTKSVEPTSDATRSKRTTRKKSGVVIHVTITDGEYKGNTYTLKPGPRSPCFVGRSAGKKFRERGISLPKDGEVSTTHGKFEVKDGKAWYTDTGSTNGTLYQGEELEDNVPLELKDGLELQLGATILLITLES